jgi:hypothetical protein
MATDTPSMREDLARLRDLYLREGDCFAGGRTESHDVEIGSFGKLPISAVGLAWVEEVPCRIER